MRDRGGQLPHHAHPAQVCEMGFELPPTLTLFFCLFAILDVRENSMPPEDISARIAHRYATSQKPAIFPGRGRTHACLVLQGLAGIEGGAPLVQKDLTIFRVTGSHPTSTRRV